MFSLDVGLIYVLFACIRLFIMIKMTLRLTKNQLNFPSSVSNSFKKNHESASQQQFYPTHQSLHQTPKSSNPLPTYEATIEQLNKLQTNQQSRLISKPNGTDNVTKMRIYASRLDIQDKINALNFVHVTGTKGKGSTCAYIEYYLRQKNFKPNTENKHSPTINPQSTFKTGLFASPHLISVRERIRLNGQPVSENLFTEHFWKVFNKLEIKKSEHLKTVITVPSHPGYFGFLTLVALSIFIQEQVSVVVFEVGIGGKFDSTNIIDAPKTCVITPIGLDHVEILGDTCRKIALQKFGIVTPGSTVFTNTNYQRSDVIDVVKKETNKMKKKAGPGQPKKSIGLKLIDKKADRELFPQFQAENALLAKEVADFWLEKYSHQNKENFTPCNDGESNDIGVDELVNSVKFPGRAHTVTRNKINYYLDGAHTSESLEKCFDWFSLKMISRPKCRNFVIFNVTGKRDYEVLLELLYMKLAEHYRDNPAQSVVVIFVPNILKGVENQTTGNEQDNRTVTESSVRAKCLKMQEHWSKISENETVSSNYENQKISSIVVDCIQTGLKYVENSRNVCEHNECKSVLVTGSIHLVGGVLKLLDQEIKFN